MQYPKSIFCRRALLALMPLALLSVGGCWTYEDPTPMRQEVPQLAVQRVYYSHPVRFDAMNNRPLATEMDQARAFLTQIGVDRKDVLEVRYSEGPIHETQAEILRALLVDQGYRTVLRPLQGAALQTDGGASAVTIAVPKVVVKLPDCPNWSSKFERRYENVATPNFGCAHVTNLGMMVADPRDLMNGRSAANWDGERAASAVERYHLRETEPLLKEDLSTSDQGSSGGE